MCHKSPGPRCAHHLRTAIQTAREQSAANLVAFTNSQEPPHPGVEGRLAQLRDEFDETRTGQAELAAQINALENAQAEHGGPDQFDIDLVRSRMLNAADRRAARLAAAKSIEAGDPRAAKYQLRYGAHAGWLAHADLPAQTQECGGPTVYRDYAIGTSVRDAHAEQIGYEEQAQEVTVVDTVCGYEAPVRPGPRPGTWLVGLDQVAHNRAPGRILPALEMSGPRQGFRPVCPVLYDETTGTVARYDLGSGLTLGSPIPVGAPEALGVLDYNDGLELAEALEARGATVHTFEAKVAVTETAAGPLLRGTFEVSTLTLR